MVVATSTPTGHGIEGDLAYRIFSISANADTAITIVSGIPKILHADFIDKTSAARGILDWTTTAGSVAITGLSASDVCNIKVWGPVG